MRGGGLMENGQAPMNSGAGATLAIAMVWQAGQVNCPSFACTYVATGVPTIYVPSCSQFKFVTQGVHHDQRYDFAVISK